MHYQVRFVGDKDLPAGIDWAFAGVAGDALFFIKESRVTPEVLGEAWAAWDNPERRYSSSSRSPTLSNA